MKKIIADSTLTQGDDDWPLTPPTFRMSCQLYNLLRCAVPNSDGINLVLHLDSPRHDWIRGEWVQRLPEDAPNWKWARYADATLTDKSGKAIGAVRVRRVWDDENCGA